MRRTAGALIAFLFATLSFIANTAGDENSISHLAHISVAYGPRLACADCHGNNTPLLSDGQNLAGTAVCDTCHSPGGIYHGVDSIDDSVGARDNWDTVIYSGGELAAGKEKWCAGCHDDAPAVVKGVSAPNIAGSDTGDRLDYGYYITGHGKHGYQQAITCLACHDASRGHVDGEPRTYAAAAKNYQSGYRLKSLSGKPPLRIPRAAAGANAEDFLLCFSCHDSTPFLTKENTDTNFRTDVNDSCVPLDPAGGLVNKHWYHLLANNSFKRWDSDADTTADSLISCPACHNVHGPRLKNDPKFPDISHAPAMVRTGEEMGRASSLNLDYLVNPCPDYNTHSATNELFATTAENKDSTGGVMKFQGPAKGSIQKTMVDGNLTFTLSDANSGIDWTTFSIQLSGDKGYVKTYTDLDTSVVTKTGTSASYVVTVNPDADFANEEVITVAVSAQDAAGNSLQAPAWSFTTGVLPSGVMLYWKFDEGWGGTVYDATLNNNGTVTDQAGFNPPWQPWTSDSMSGSAFRFPNNGGYFMAGPWISLPTGGTIEMWAKKNSHSTCQTYISKGGSPADDGNHTKYFIRERWDTGQVALNWEAGASVIVSNSALPVGEWNHIVGTWDGANMKLYLNGQEATTYSMTSFDCQQPIVANQGIRLGAIRYGAGFDGTIDEMVSYSRALSAAEVMSRYDKD